MSIATYAADASSDSIAASLRTWWTILRISLGERLVYRGDFMLGTLDAFEQRYLAVVVAVDAYAKVHLV